MKGTVKPSLLGTKEAANLLGVSANTLLRWVKEGKIKAAIRLPSGYYRFERETVEAFRSDLELAADE